MGLKTTLLKAIYSQVQKQVSKNGARITAAMAGDTSVYPESWTDHSTDYVRYKTLQMAAREINTHQVPGDIAELGVFQGKFAQIMSEVFPDRDFYLFDTFEGFSADQAAADQAAGHFQGGVQSFADTSVERVLARLPHRDKAIVRKGFFPATFEGLEDKKFAFVSLDPDLYEPVRDGLREFWPRLSPGGFIFVHDYNNKYYQGVRKAVDEFCREEHCNVVQIPDNCGTAVFAKPY